jgi:hypothetical protein
MKWVCNYLVSYVLELFIILKIKNKRHEKSFGFAI